ncbi:MAG: bifunctional fucokinase/L-fucose-1-P-guanylyltransferase [Clostridia bacterium]|nr:bifunctional fucokinase/L-fucose-1-P-guanylyltransferase [Clostridia bacterium]
MAEQKTAQALTEMQMISMFLRQSLLDSEADYMRSLRDAQFPHWDCVALTASNETQADGYRRQISERSAQGRLPCGTDFLVVPDEGGKRIGSAGATFSVVRRLREKYGSLSGRRFLVIHAGGNGSRTPQYSALGKLFSPVPMMLAGASATLFDLFLVCMASVPARTRPGMLLLSGDVALLFNPLMCDFGTVSAAAVTFKEDVQTAKNHGVFLKNDEGFLQKYLHKQPVETLRAEGAADSRDKCCIDTGALWFGEDFLDVLHGLIVSPDAYAVMVNDRARLSLYGDLVYCLSQEATEESLLRQTPEGELCPELETARRRLWQGIGGYSMRVHAFSPARFIHFGSVPEILRLMHSGIEEYRSLGWQKQTNCSIPDASVAGYNAAMSADAAVGAGSYLECAIVHAGATVGRDCYISFLDVGQETIPDHVLLHGLKEKNGRFICRIMDVGDNPKQDALFRQKLSRTLDALGFTEDDVWPAGAPHTLWDAALYPECGSIRDAVAAALNVYALFHDLNGDREGWLRASRKSLHAGFEDADTQAILDWDRRMNELVRMDEIKKLIREQKPAAETQGVFSGHTLTKIQKQWLQEELQKLDLHTLSDFSYAMRLYYYLGEALGSEDLTKQSFRLISDAVQSAARETIRYDTDCRIVRDSVSVHLPLRVNWGGGWTDTCPHCLERGGTVLNAAISLAGTLPVQVSVRRIPEEKIVFDSRDLNEHGEFDTIGPLQRTGDPFDPFALQKACLLACGVLPDKGGDLHGILQRMGGGFEMRSEVRGVPKGSGLGTSSILSAASVKAMFDFLGKAYDDNALYGTVLSMEQIMSTGGGWQDQVGGLAPGIKLITSEPGLRQRVRVDSVSIPDETLRELSDRFVLIYTGQRRLARNILRSVVGRYIGSDPQSLYAHGEIRRKAVLMRFALEHGDVDGFARLLDEHWTLSKMIDAGSTNTLIEQIFLCIDDLIDGRMVCGAGGGGFLQVVMKRGVTRADVRARLKNIFLDFPVDVWDSAFAY